MCTMRDRPMVHYGPLPPVILPIAAQATKLGHPGKSPQINERKHPQLRTIIPKRPAPRRAFMRLTLRTLLAYLDDSLEPAQAKLIGQKIAESEQARDLIARIQQVTRRRRITTPPDSGPGGKLDPNTLGEYLDNVITPEQAAEVEEICLTSDPHLAEIAACHQILSLVLGEPTLVPPSAKQRMYGLVKGPEAIPFRKPAPAARSAEPDVAE